MKNRLDLARCGRDVLVPSCIVFSVCSSLRAAEHQVSNAFANDAMGDVSLSGDMFLAASPRGYWPAYDEKIGKVHLFRNVVGATGTTTQSVRLNPSDPASLSAGGNEPYFGNRVALFGEYAIIGAPGDRRGVAAGPVRGSAYFYKGLDTATGTITQNVKLDTVEDSYQLGSSVALVNDTALVGARGTGSGGDEGSGTGVVYVYRNLSAAGATRTPNARLLASDSNTINDFFGSDPISVGGNTAIVGASGKGAGGGAYLFRNINTVTGNVNENARLRPSDLTSGDSFGSASSVSANGAVALVAARTAGTGSAGAVYLFRGLGSATGVVNEDAKLISSDLAAADFFGSSVDLSGNNAIVGAPFDDDTGSASGSAYIYTGLGTATGTVTENVKITASDGAANNGFGSSVSIEGDQFVVAAQGGDGAAVDSGKAYSGTVSSMTTFNAGNSTGVIGGISFESRQNWVIGRTTDNNVVVLNVGDTANVITTGTSVEIGEFSGANGNQLMIAGNLEANQVNIGIEQIGGNSGNSLRFENTATFDIDEIRLTPGNSLGLGPAGHNYLIIEQQVAEINALMAYLGSTDFLGTIDGGATWQQINASNYEQLIRWDYGVTNAGATTIWLIPEPNTAALGMIGAGLMIGRRRRVASITAASPGA